ADGGLLHRQRLPAAPARRGRGGGGRPGRPGRGVRAVLPRPRADLHARRARVGHPHHGLPAELRLRAALRRDRRHRGQARGGRAGGPHHARGQRRVAGRRERVGAAQRDPGRRAAARAQRDRPGDRPGAAAGDAARRADGRRTHLLRHRGAGRAAERRGRVPRALRLPDGAAATARRLGGRLGRRGRAPAGQADEVPAAGRAVLMPASDRFRGGVVIPAHPLALTEDGAVDLVAQRALTRYYVEAGAHGVAVGVHTTQFELHADQGLFTEVLGLAAEAARGRLLVAGVCGDVADAVREAEAAAALGYEAALLCPWGVREPTEKVLLERARAVGEVLPTIGFYLQESVGGRRLDRAFWQDLFDIETVVAVKSAPFDRYRHNDVVQALLEHDRWADVAVLTGNDDAIVHDLVTPVRRTVGGQTRE